MIRFAPSNPPPSWLEQKGRLRKIIEKQGRKRASFLSAGENRKISGTCYRYANTFAVAIGILEKELRQKITPAGPCVSRTTLINHPKLGGTVINHHQSLSIIINRHQSLGSVSLCLVHLCCTIPLFYIFFVVVFSRRLIRGHVKGGNDNFPMKIPETSNHNRKILFLLRYNQSCGVLVLAAVAESVRT